MRLLTTPTVIKCVQAALIMHSISKVLEKISTHRFCLDTYYFEEGIAAIGGDIEESSKNPPTQPHSHSPAACLPRGRFI